jgi:hypothetical protein
MNLSLQIAGPQLLFILTPPFKKVRRSVVFNVRIAYQERCGFSDGATVIRESKLLYFYELINASICA